MTPGACGSLTGMHPTVHTRTPDVPWATITYDLRGSLPPRDGRRVLVLIGQPMDAHGVPTLAGILPPGDYARTAVTYDPRGLGRSTRSDGRHDNDPVVQAEGLPRLVQELGCGPVDVLGSSGGGVAA